MQLTREQETSQLMLPLCSLLTRRRASVQENGLEMRLDDAQRPALHIGQ